MKQTPRNDMPPTQWDTLTLSQAMEFDSLINKLIPHYGSTIEALVGAVPFERSAPIHVLDLGCGTGTVSASVVAGFPNARLTCLDIGETMIAMAKIKLAAHPQISYVLEDFSRFDFAGTYDAVFSLALHHLVADEDKKQTYGRIYNSLSRGGVFFNADVVLGSNDCLQEANMRQWSAFMGRQISQQEIDGNWLPKYYAEDHPARLMDQLAWLAQIGFSDVDVTWKYYNFAVYGGTKR